jgi:hypothetical protein
MHARGKSHESRGLVNSHCSTQDGNAKGRFSCKTVGVVVCICTAPEAETPTCHRLADATSANGLSIGDNRFPPPIYIKAKLTLHDKRVESMTVFSQKRLQELFLMTNHGSIEE